MKKHMALIIMFFGIPLMLFSTYAIFSRLSIDANGVIMSSKIVKGGYSKYKSVYRIKTSNDRYVDYETWGNDDELIRDLPVETAIEKHRWEIKYRVNGEEMRDYFANIYLTMFSLGFILSLSAYIIKKKVSPGKSWWELLVAMNAEYGRPKQMQSREIIEKQGDS